MRLENCELIQITGGAINITGAFLNSIGRALDAIMDVGRSLGTSIRRIYSRRVC